MAKRASRSPGPPQLRLIESKPRPEPAKQAEQYSDRIVPSVEEWQALHAAAARFRKLAPWEWLYDTDMFGVKDPETGVIGYCSVMGKLGQHFCLAAYMGSWGLSGYIQLLEDAKPQSSAEMLEYQDCLMASFEDRAMLDTQDLKVIRELGLKFRGRGAWPMFRRYRRGYCPWFINGAEARFLAIALEQALDVAVRARSDAELLQAGDDDRYLVRVRMTGASGPTWRDERLTPELLSLQEQAATVGAVPFPAGYVQELSRSAGTRHGTWELDIDYLPTPMQEQPDSQPYYPRQLIVADADTGLILGTTMGSPVDHVEVFRSQLADTVRTLGRLPARFLVNNDRSRAFLTTLAHALDIPIERGRLKAVEHLRRELKKRFPQYYE